LEKIEKNFKLSDDELRESFFKLLIKINFINEEIIPEKVYDGVYKTEFI